MSLSANSYGTVADVAEQVGRYTNSGQFDADTRPKLTQVENDINRVSAIANVLLAENGFATPVSAAQPKLAIDLFVIAQVVQLAHGANGAGPFAPGSEELRDGRTPFQIITTEAANFFSEHADGLEALGASRTRKLLDSLACRTVDDAGDDIHPMFQRKQFGNVVLDWDEE